MKVILTIVGILLLILVSVAYVIFGPVPVSAALLYVNSGEVLVDIGDSFSQATDGMELEVGNKVKTNNGTATLILNEGEIISLTEFTEITLSSISSSAINIAQSSGVTWNKITKLSGINKYTVQTPTTLATVRGTEFVLSVDQLDVLEGIVSYGTKEQPDKLSVDKNKRVKAAQNVLEDIPESDLKKYERFKDDYSKALVKLREHEIRKQIKYNKIIVREAERRGFDEQKIMAEAKTVLNDVDEGRKNEDELYAKVPLPLKPKTERVYELTKKIKEVKRDLPLKKDQLMDRNLVSESNKMINDVEPGKKIMNREPSKDETKTGMSVVPLDSKTERSVLPVKREDKKVISNSVERKEFERVP